MTRTHLGKQVWVADGVPATNDAAGFAALTWIRVNGFVGGFQLGFAASNIDIPDPTTELRVVSAGGWRPRSGGEWHE